MTGTASSDDGSAERSCLTGSERSGSEIQVGLTAPSSATAGRKARNSAPTPPRRSLERVVRRVTFGSLDGDRKTDCPPAGE